MQIEYTVLENGFDFILASIKDLTRIDETALANKVNKRHIKYSLLHLSSGVELVFKHKLLQGNWAYVFMDMDKAKKADLQSGDFVSVGSDAIVKRLENLCEIKLEKNEVECFRILRRTRNIAEHFSLKGDILSLKNLIHNSITILIKIILEHYDPNEFTKEEQELFGEIRSTLHQSDQHYDDALAIAQKELERSGLEYSVQTCPQCFEEFLLIDHDGDGLVKCSSCSYEAQSEKAARDYIDKVLGVTEDDVAKYYGGIFPLFDCPECNDWTLVHDMENGSAICFSCGLYEPYVSLSTCRNCERRVVYVQYAGEESVDCPECGEEIPYEDD